MNKPDLKQYFLSMPFIGQYLSYDYQQANSLVDMIELTFKWLNEAEKSKNAVRKQCFQESANYLYGLITCRTFETTKYEIF